MHALEGRGARSGLRSERGVEWEITEETLTRDFILGCAYGHGLGYLGLGLFSKAGIISVPPRLIGVFLVASSFIITIIVNGFLFLITTSVNKKQLPGINRGG